MREHARFSMISRFLKFQVEVVGAMIDAERERVVAKVAELPDVDSPARRKAGSVLGFRREEFLYLAGQALMLRRFCEEYDDTLTAQADALIGVAYRIASGINLAELEIRFPVGFESSGTPAAVLEDAA